MLIAGYTGSASAHVLRQDGPAAAVMHVEPDDYPVSGKQTSIVFDFTDSASGFDLRRYKLSFSASWLDQGRQSQVNVKDSRLAFVRYTFPAPAVYDLYLTGKPLDGGQPFVLTYEMRVDRSGNSNNGDPAAAQTVVLVSIASFCILGLVARRNIAVGGRYR